MQHGLKLEMEDPGGAVQDHALALLREPGVGPHPQNFLVELAKARERPDLPPTEFCSEFCRRDC